LVWHKVKYRQQAAEAHQCLGGFSICIGILSIDVGSTQQITSPPIRCPLLSGTSVPQLRQYGASRYGDCVRWRTGIAFVKAWDSGRRFASSGRFTRYGCRYSWRLDVYIDFLGLAAATAEKLAAEEKESGDNDDHKDHEYGHDCGVAAATIIISHKIYPPLCTHHSLFVGDVTVFGC
jgi:hypothetical protein